MKVIRYINNEPIRGNHMPQTRVDNPAVVRVIKDVNRRIKSHAQVLGEGQDEGTHSAV